MYHVCVCVCVKVNEWYDGNFVFCFLFLPGKSSDKLFDNARDWPTIGDGGLHALGHNIKDVVISALPLPISTCVGRGHHKLYFCVLEMCAQIGHNGTYIYIYCFFFVTCR